VRAGTGPVLTTEKQWVKNDAKKEKEEGIFGGEELGCDHEAEKNPGESP
jgi:hypothetical protein